MSDFEHSDGTALDHEPDFEAGGFLVSRGKSTVFLPTDVFRWLVLTAGPAALCERARQGDAGTGGGPAPAAPDATEPADEPEPDLFSELHTEV